jgi:Domain of unknown function (DUF4917)
LQKLLTFQQILDETEGRKRNAILGNGFSIACKPKIFTYASLFSMADFTKNPELPLVFAALGTQDFEIAINALQNMSALLPIYMPGHAAPVLKMQQDADVLKKILIETVTKNHPDSPIDVTEDQYLACRQFLANFIGENTGKVFTLNYDLLLYWTVMHTEFSDGQVIDLAARDGFGDDDAMAPEDYVTWQGEIASSRSTMFYLHGALHLFDDGANLRKFTWIRTGDRLKQQSWAAISSGALPLFVSEGTTEAKMQKITHSAYLYQAYRALRNAASSTKDAFVVYGHSLADNDLHIFKALARGRFPTLYVSLFGDPTSATNEAIVKQARKLQELRRGSPLEVKFFDAQSAAVWG